MSFTAGDKQRFLEQELAMKIMQLGMMVSQGDISQADADRQLAMLKEMIADYQALHIAERTHELKSWPDFFKPMALGEKMFSTRKHDRDFQKGDLVIFREWDDRTQKYTGAKIERRIKYIEHGIGQGAIEPLMGLHRGYCTLGLEHPLSSNNVVNFKGDEPHSVPCLDAPEQIEDELEAAGKQAYSGIGAIGKPWPEPTKQEADHADSSDDGGKPS